MSAPIPQQPMRVTVVDFDMSFVHMVSFFVKATFAAIPAALIIIVIVMLITAVFGGIFGGLGKFR